MHDDVSDEDEAGLTESVPTGVRSRTSSINALGELAAVGCVLFMVLSCLCF